MHYYPHHIGDFIRDTARLSDGQCMAYLRLIWAYYDAEKPLVDDAEALAFQIGSTADVVRQILAHYFQKTDEGWRHTRCDAVISDYHNKQEKARRSANARWSDANAMRTHAERNAKAPKNDANQEPITNNQKKEKAERSPNGSRLPPDWVCPDEWLDFCRQTRPDLDPKMTACRFADYWHGVAGQKGRKLDWAGTWRNWVRGEKAPARPTFAQQAADVARVTVPAKQGPDPTLQRLIEDGLKAVPPPPDVRQKLAALRVSPSTAPQKDGAE